MDFSFISAILVGLGCLSCGVLVVLAKESGGGMQVSAAEEKEKQRPLRNTILLLLLLSWLRTIVVFVGVGGDAAVSIAVVIVISIRQTKAAATCKQRTTNVALRRRLLVLSYTSTPAAALYARLPFTASIMASRLGLFDASASTSGTRPLPSFTLILSG